MIDPKLNEIPVDAEFEDELTEDELTTDDLTEDDLTEDEQIARSRATASRGLSVNDTIARNANLSVGARGVDTSGIAAGAGAGAGSTSLTPADDDSPAPQIVPGNRGTGSTPLSDSPSGKTSTDRTKP